MYWMQPPPYLRWAAAVLLVVGALLWDLRGSATESYPFASREISAGASLTEEDITWRSLPARAFEVPDLSAAVAVVDVAPGDPIVSSMLTGPVAIPDDWWAVPIAVGVHATPGEAVMLVVIDPPLTVPGIVISAQRGDRYSLDHRPALVAVPGDLAALVAAAEVAGMLVTAVRPAPSHSLGD